MISTSSQVRILHIDDNEDDRIIAKHHFSRLSDSVEIVWAESADEARDVLKNGDIDCIISDYQMPTEDGLHFLRSLRKEDEELPFILLTGNGNEEIASRAFQWGADDYFSKVSGSTAYKRVLNSALNLIHAYTNKLHSERAEAKFHQLFSDNVSGVFEIDKSGAIIDANDSFYNLVGFEEDESRKNLRFSGLFEKPVYWQRFVGALRLNGRFEKQLVRFVDRKLISVDVLIQARLADDGNTILGTVREARHKTVEDSNGVTHSFSIDHFLSNTAVPVFYFVLDHPISCGADNDTKMDAVSSALLGECNSSFMQAVYAEDRDNIIGKNFDEIFASECFKKLRTLIIDFARSDQVWRQAELEPGSGQYYTLYSVRREDQCIGFWGTIVL